MEKTGTSKRNLSKRLGLKPDELAIALADSTLERFRFNTEMLANALVKMGLIPSEDLLI